MGWQMAGRRRSGAAVASALVLLAALAACGQQASLLGTSQSTSTAPSAGVTSSSSGLPASSSSELPAASSVSSSGGSAAPTSAGPATPGDLERPSPSPVSSAGEVNRKAAEVEADRLLALAPVPPTAVQIPAAQATMAGPAVGVAKVDTMATRARVWRVALPYATALVWLKAHPPSGLTSNVSGSGGGPGFHEEGYGYQGPPSSAWQTSQLAMTVASVSAKESEIRADVAVLWLDPTPLPDKRPGQRAHLTVADGCPKTDKGLVGVTNSGADLVSRMLPAGVPTSGLVCTFGGLNPPGAFTLLASTRLDAAAAGRLADQARAIRLGHTDGGLYHCPADLGRVTLAVFSFPGRDDVDLWSTDGCATVSNGVIFASGQLTP